MSKSSSIIETELIRKNCWDKIRARIIQLKLEDENGRLLNTKECSNLMLRYVFNKIITRTPQDDPVFITSHSSISRTQVQDDFTYHRIVNCDPAHFTSIMEDGLIEGAKAIKTSNNEDKTLAYDTSSNCILYRGIMYPDVNGLGMRNKKHMKEALALYIRYTYLKIATNGLANDYKGMGFKPEDCIEAFASSFNHYFTRYHSAFPDLEKCFGSQGSFFETSLISGNYMINPPFDMQVMKYAIIKILSSLEVASSKEIDLEITLTLPAWMDVKEFLDLEANKYTTSFAIIPKDKTSFIDHMSGKTISPCSIIQVKLRSLVRDPLINIQNVQGDSGAARSD